MIITFIFLLQLLALLLAWVGKRDRAIIVLGFSLLTSLYVFIGEIDTITSIIL